MGDILLLPEDLRQVLIDNSSMSSDVSSCLPLQQQLPSELNTGKSELKVYFTIPTKSVESVCFPGAFYHPKNQSGRKPGSAAQCPMRAALFPMERI